MDIQDECKQNIYQIEIKEELSTVVSIRADSLLEALAEAESKYKSSEIILDAECFKGVKFEEYFDEAINIRSKSKKR